METVPVSVEDAMRALVSCVMCCAMVAVGREADAQTPSPPSPTEQALTEAEDAALAAAKAEEAAKKAEEAAKEAEEAAKRAAAAALDTREHAAAVREADGARAKADEAIQKLEEAQQSAAKAGEHADATEAAARTARRDLRRTFKHTPWRLMNNGKALTPDEIWANWCDQHRLRTRAPRGVDGGRYPSRSEYLVCADITSESAFVGPSTWNRWDFPLPHSEILLLVRSDTGTPWSVAVSGERGSYVPGTEVQAGGDDAVDLRAEHAAPDSDRSTTHQLRNLHRFQPGAVSLELTTDLADGAETARTLRTELADLWAHIERVQGYVTAKQDDQGVPKDSLQQVLTALTERKALLEKSLDELAGRSSVKATAVEGFAMPKAASAFAAAPAGDQDWTGLKTALDNLSGELASLNKAIDEVPDAPVVDVADLVVEKTYVGIARVGMAATASFVPDVDYTTGEALSSDASGVVVIQEAGRGPASLDLVTGYTHYWSRKPESSVALRPAATVGLSLASFNGGDDVEFLDMAYAGVELGWKEYGMAVVATARRIEHLRDGMETGQSVRSGVGDEDLVTHGVGMGIGVVFYPPARLFKTGKEE